MDQATLQSNIKKMRFENIEINQDINWILSSSVFSSLISSRVISGNSPLSAIALISANAAFTVTSSSSSWAFCGLSFRMVSDYFTRITHGIPRIRPIRSWAETTSY